MKLADKVITIMEEEEFLTFTKKKADTIKAKILTDFAKKCKELAAKYTDQEVASSSVPSAPDTSKFRTVVGGKVEFMTGEMIRGGYYGRDEYMSAGVKIGGGVNSKVHTAVRKEVEKLFKKYQVKYNGDSSMHIRIRFSDKKYGPHFSITLVTTGGSSWSAYGIEVKELDGAGNNSYFKLGTEI